MTYTVLKGSEADQDSECFIALGTSEFSFVIMRLSENGSQDEILAVVEQAH